MRLVLLGSLVALGCTPTTTVIGGNEKGGDGGSDADTDADSDADTDADSDADSDTDADADTDADLGAGDYVGTMEGTSESDWGGQDCTGDVTFTIADDLTLTGYAACDFGDSGNGWGWSQEGDLDGEVAADGSIDAVWTVDFGRGYIVEIPAAGDVDPAKDAAVMDAEYDFGNYGYFTGTVKAKRQ